MAHTYTSLHYHFTFSTAGRRNLIAQEPMPELHAYMGGIVRNLKGTPLAIGGTENHAHLLVGLPPTIVFAQVVAKIKANSAGWVKDAFPTMADFRWQEGYGAFTVSRSQVETVAEYIRNQAEHHKTMTFEEEYIAFLKKHGIPYEENDVFD